jgi:hypothetical protein
LTHPAFQPAHTITEHCHSSKSGSSH